MRRSDRLALLRRFDRELRRTRADAEALVALGGPAADAGRAMLGDVAEAEALLRNLAALYGGPGAERIGHRDAPSAQGSGSNAPSASPAAK